MPILGKVTQKSCIHLLPKHAHTHRHKNARELRLVPIHLLVLESPIQMVCWHFLHKRAQSPFQWRSTLVQSVLIRIQWTQWSTLH